MRGLRSGDGRRAAPADPFLRDTRVALEARRNRGERRGGQGTGAVTHMLTHRIHTHARVEQTAAKQHDAASWQPSTYSRLTVPSLPTVLILFWNCKTHQTKA